MASSAQTNSSQPALSLDRFHQVNGVVGTRQGDTTVLLDVNGGMYYTLNEVAGRVWELVGREVPLPRIVEQLQEEYEVAPETLAADTAALIERLLSAKLIEAAGR
jgi:hypothetical protein